MGRTPNYQVIQYEGFVNGYNRESDPSKLSQSELFEALNVQIGARGEVKYRSGYTLFSSNVSQIVHWLYPWRTAAGVDHLIIVDVLGNILEDTLDGSFTDSTKDTGVHSDLSDHGVAFASVGDKVYISAKTMSSDPVSFDGSSWATVAGIPKVKILLHRHERLLAINNSAYPSRVFFSNLGSPETFDALDFIDVSPNDGSEINAAVEFGDDVILFKDHEIWKLSGRTPTSFSLYRIDNKRGCVSPKSITYLSGQLVFYDRDTGIWLFDGATFTLISQPINQHILDDQTYANSYRAAGYVSDENRYYLSMEVDYAA